MLRPSVPAGHAIPKFRRLPSNRARYGACHRQYSLAVPFTERFFGLALPGTGATASRVSGSGYVGLITANSFMKREFGKKLIESFLPSVDLTHVIETGRLSNRLEPCGPTTRLPSGRQAPIPP